MKKLSVVLTIIFTTCIVGCNKKAPSPTKTQVRSISIAGMPVYEKDYQLTASDAPIQQQ